MEPDISAIPSSPVAASGHPVSDEALLAMLAREAILPADPDTHTNGRNNGHTNGHRHNGNGHGHANGHAHARVSTAVAAVPAAVPRWPAIAPVAPGTLDAYTAALPAPPREHGIYLRAGKRCVDFLGALVGLIVSSPVMLLAALAIKIESRGPILYKSVRIGRGGRPFTFYKLRSMVDGADRHRHHLTHLNECDGPVFKMSRDPRVTRVGRLLRTSSIDELPQLFNVLCGDMSLVGPRPPIPEEVVAYQPWQMRRLDVRPGITCLWQISGRSRIGFEEWMRLDLEYIRRRSARMDLLILLRTIPAVLSREGAY
jgi:lipopolysaccharide/colanic/teichoic acid biosynthesis glycosyltransferase